MGDELTNTMKNALKWELFLEQFDKIKNESMNATEKYIKLIDAVEALRG